LKVKSLKRKGPMVGYQEKGNQVYYEKFNRGTKKKKKKKKKTKKKTQTSIRRKKGFTKISSMSDGLLGFRKASGAREENQGGGGELIITLAFKDCKVRTRALRPSRKRVRDKHFLGVNQKGIVYGDRQ